LGIRLVADPILGWIDMNLKAKILFEPIGRIVIIERGESILDAAIRNSIGLRSECSGAQKCGKCKVVIRDQTGVTALDKNEFILLSQTELSEGYRLACTVRLLPETEKVTVNIPRESILRERRFTKDRGEKATKLDPIIQKYTLKLGFPYLQIGLDPKFIKKGLKSQHKLSRISISEKVNENLIKFRFKNEIITAVVRDRDTLVSLESGDTSSILFGLAIDIGTSRVTARIVDLKSGVNLSSASTENPQIIYGENIMSRATYAQKSDENKLKLRRSILDCINQLINRLTKELRISYDDIYQVVIVGNTVMHHFLLGLETKRLTHAPFSPSTKEMIQLTGEESSLNISPLGVVTFLPIIDAFVGADAVADIVSSGLYRKGAPTLLLDVGTNTELILRVEGEILSCSCASGPAFEGEHIENGMKAVDGAIESIRIKQEGIDVEFKTLGSGYPIGICGSAIVDVVAELLKADIINRVGRFKTDLTTSRLIQVNNARKFIIAWSEESGTGSPITISERDINEVILAKAAIHSAAQVLMKTKNITSNDLKRIFIAGAFGNHLNKNNAKRIGMIPDVESRRITYIGNAALNGATMALKSRKIHQQTKQIPRKTRYIELATNLDFELGFKKSLLLQTIIAK
jgi:uncharacterized 2Fe-2S/4Fe-4S cluster protein (DUF4445 family)